MNFLIKIKEAIAGWLLERYMKHLLKRHGPGAVKDIEDILRSAEEDR